MQISTERRQNDGAKLEFLLTGFTQIDGIRIYAYERRVDTGRSNYTVEVDLALIPGYGIRIQDLPLLCRELLQQRVQPDEISAFVFTEQQMRSHAEKVAIAREDAEHRKKQPKHVVSANTGAGWRKPFR